ncbi:tRNA lysidine(34) synthetase TilS [Gracilibacillus kekensis]|uniref:tRNA(Ile)-lysidine synthase n=1 Tax=Gracilibacillus kekensis TaxID=1027249 RepID=A0A1M7QZ76_9BACI|nr:tRNA lysidine(34) synthetase TilS [Gracilibacillus kekensis]SHN37419.1 tRNA(Ile)-lysidine synthase [Gracilibacillus kekensis]
MKKSTLDHTVLSFINRHQLLHNGATVLIGVSGGADSLLLLRYLQTLQSTWQLNLVVLSIDHGLRGVESADDVKYVESICRQWGVPFIARQVDVKSRKSVHKEGTQLAARKLRYQVFEETMKEVNADLLALAHHGDDQIETVLMRMVRQSNPSLLQGIPVKRSFANGSIIRPFLCLSKHEIYQYCQEYQIVPREDPSNQSTTYTRNFFRLKVLPLLKQQNDQIHQHIQAMTERAAEDQIYLESKANDLINKMVSMKDNAVYFNIESFKAYPIALQRRAFHLILNYLYQEVPVDLSYQHEADFFALLNQEKSNVSLDFPASLKVAKNYQEIRFHFLNKIHKEWEDCQTIKVPSTVSLANGATLSINYTSRTSHEDHHTLHIPKENESLLPLNMRVRKPGDRMMVRGLKGHKKVKDIFIDEKVPVYKRDRWPLIFGADGTLLWIIGLKKAEIKQSSSSNEYIVLTYTDSR